MRAIFLHFFLTFFCIPLVAICARLLPKVIPYRPSQRHLSVHPSIRGNISRVPPSFNINAGGPNNSRFITDEEGSWVVGTTSTFSSEEVEIGGAELKNLLMYYTNRYGTHATIWGYDIPVQKPGVYNCTAHFAELNYPAVKPGERVFDLIMATSYGKPNIFKRVDIIGDLNGAEFTVLTKTALNIVITGILSVRLVPIVGDATLSGITCLRGAELPANATENYTIPPVPSPPPILPVPDKVSQEFNINCGGDSIGRFTAENFAWINGNTSTFTGPPNSKIGGAEEKNEPALLSHRYGISQSTFGYDIAVEEPGVYECSLHFAETHAESFFAGARVFDIVILDRSLKTVDIFADAGNAEFTSVVKTFPALAIDSMLTISLIPRVGNAFISAITCVQTGEFPDASQSPEESGEASSPSVIVVPTLDPASSPGGTPEVLPIVTVETTPIPSALPLPSGLNEGEPPVATNAPDVTDPTPGIIVSGTPQAIAGVNPRESVEVSPNMAPNEDFPDPSDDEPTIAGVDKELVANEGETLRKYLLSIRVDVDGIFTDGMKNALKTVSEQSSEVESTWALTGLKESDPATSTRALAVARQTGTVQSYEVDVQAVYREEYEKEASLQYRSFVRNGDATKRMEDSGYSNVNVQLRDLQSATGAAAAEGGNASLIVVVTVVSLLVVLTVAAVVVFMAVNRRRRFEGRDFDAPPPELSESEGSSAMDRSENGESLDDEYIDDDSTYTAATSRVGEHVDQVSFVKDVFGRGTAEASGAEVHGVP